jgi:hypothetical protein
MCGSEKVDDTVAENSNKAWVAKKGIIKGNNATTDHRPHKGIGKYTDLECTMRRWFKMVTPHWERKRK